jgi:hypothetical protein
MEEKNIKFAVCLGIIFLLSVSVAFLIFSRRCECESEEQEDWGGHGAGVHGMGPGGPRPTGGPPGWSRRPGPASWGGWGWPITYGGYVGPTIVQNTAIQDCNNGCCEPKACQEGKGCLWESPDGNKKYRGFPSQCKKYRECIRGEQSRDQECAVQSGIN